ncbi:unnamed protein product [Bemisia tabaci]|uniref:Cation/H+ exchanger transmembrane domain-containing protein n=1 Tax=Bemisia tabaci TaxID=7038 RepID=A0A9P0F5W0_BEMTA|nr:unnamed protein product [Bemisia tabaci]
MTKSLSPHSGDNDVSPESPQPRETMASVLQATLGVPEETKRRVSISLDAIQADEQKHGDHSSPNSINSRYQYTNPSFTSSEGGINGSGPPGAFHKRPSWADLGKSCMHNSSRKSYSLDDTDNEKQEDSCWFWFCLKCRQKEVGPGWEPWFWTSVCPHPFCPSYRHVARVVSHFILGFLLWGILYTLMGHDVAPGGQLFNIALLCISANFGGWVFRMLTIPPLVGMLLVGMLYQNIGLIDIHPPYVKVVATFRKIALVVLLTRAGLDLDPSVMHKLCGTILRIGLVPWIVEAACVSCGAYWIFGMPWLWATLFGSVVAAVSPAVVVPALLKLRGKGYGIAKGIPTLIIAVSGIDDAASVVAFGILYNAIFSEESFTYTLLVGPISIIGGIGFGTMWGLLSKYIPEKEDPYVVPIRILTLLGGGLIAVFGSEYLGMEGAGPLGVIAAAFMCSLFWSKQGWEVGENPVSTAFEIFWMIFEPILFGLTGTQIKINEMNPQDTTMLGAILLGSIVARMLITLIVCIGAKLNTKEKIFTGFACMTKASVQAALAPVALETVRKMQGSDMEVEFARTMSLGCILSILMTAPLGALILAMTGTRLLTKTKASPAPPQGWRRGARPSLRDITITDEPMDEEDPEPGPDSERKEESS